MVDRSAWWRKMFTSWQPGSKNKGEEKDRSHNPFQGYTPNELTSFK
jgi:hypothetical protein